MEWEAIGAIGEIVGGVVVVVSLLYLSAQLRQSNRHAEAASQAAWINGWNGTIKGWVENPEVITAVRNGFDRFSDLEDEQKAVFHMQMAALQNQWVLAAELRERDLMPEAVFSGATEVLASVYSTPGGRQFLNQNAPATPRGEEVLALVDSAESRPGALPPFTELFPWWSART